ncbi:MAG: proline--tRNA ligase [Oscillospiraceae bacterium]|nr:proline--tRNA ligase [Oscillospiraceae bacterium]
MKLDRLVGERFKERPAEAVIDSHALMVRGGYMKLVSNGIYSSYTLLRRITRKLENIVRQEMDSIDGQEVLFPVVMPASLWQESQRYESVGDELLRFNDRTGTPMLLGMTHEEAAVHLVREYGQTYTKYPFMIYQIQTKFRDELRSRGGLLRVREFTMKDAYSFHTSQSDLDNYYMRCFQAYMRIFQRVGLEQVIAIASNSGMMGGSKSHEFMLETTCGEDLVVTCSNCDYKANMELAECIVVNNTNSIIEPLAKVFTPEMKTIEEVSGYLNLPLEQSCKAVVYQIVETEEYLVVFIRGDLEVNETKLTGYLGQQIYPALISEKSGLTAGYIGPYMLQGVRVLFDSSLKGAVNLCCGANEENYHYTGLNIEREVGEVEYIDLAKVVEHSICPICNESTLMISKGIELGHIFQLGTKYTEKMNMRYVDEHGNSLVPTMGCYGIGIGRLVASICEVSHDDYGPIWPFSIAPWQVHICCLHSSDISTKQYADKLYEELQNTGIEVIYDDRVISAGVMFSDADLIGVPIRIIISPRNMKEGIVEVVSRDKVMNERVDMLQAANLIKALIERYKNT